MALPHSAYGWFVSAERGALRLLMIAIGFILMVVGLALGVTMVMLPPGLFFGFTGFALVVWGGLGELPTDHSGIDSPHRS
jgi:predicted cobalt transporter CbtA